MNNNNKHSFQRKMTANSADPKYGKEWSNGSPTWNFESLPSGVETQIIHRKIKLHA